jgi:HAE1 family hydrophobic/amphiphilic exporter-1
MASLVGAREITGAATSASLAILAIFAPVVFMDGIIGKFFFQFGVAISVAILISLLEALTLAPMRCSQFLNLRSDNWLTTRVGNLLTFLTSKYEIALRFCLNWRWSVIGVSILIFAASLFTIKNLRKEFIPPQDQSRFMVNIYTPMGSSIEFTDNVFREVEKIMKDRPEIDRYYIAVGGFGGGLVNQGISFVTMKEPGERPFAPPLKAPQTQQEFMPVLRGLLEKVPGVQRVALMDLSLTGFSAQRGYPIEFQVQGPDWGKLAAASTDLRKRLKDTGLMSDVETDYNPNMPQLEIYPDRAKAAQRGVPVTTISNAIAAMVGGMKLLPSKYTDESGHRNDIKIKLVEGQNRNPADIEKIQVRNSMGWLVSLKELIEVKEGSSLLTISRYNRERGIGIFGNFAPGKSQAEITDKIESLAKETLPEGYHVVLSGNSKAFADSFKSLMFALILGIFVAYMVLASQFNSFIHPVTILLALPFSITGALLAMSLTNTSLNIYSLIGILLLMGIVKKNSILLVEFTNHKRAEGLSVQDALISACPVRLRPILMTSIATIAGALPEALATGEGSEVIRPMAIAVVGGVAVSTFLTLFVVPCGYSLFSRLENKEHAEDIHEAFEELSHA